MFPLKDLTYRKSFPLINYLIIISNFAVFLYQVSYPDFDKFVYNYGFVPSKYSPFEVDFYKYAFFSMWLHGGWFHFLSNMWFLHIFGDNVEDKLGHLTYLLFYIFSGFSALFLQYLMSLSSSLPMIGASGAVSGVAGAYFVLFNRSKILTLVIGFLGFIHLLELPAWFFLGYWFVIQLFSGIGSLLSYDPNIGGIAWFAHLGGFVYGYWTAKKFKNRAFS
ncbi:MAG: rhomboid family intramembrane serine protease [Patescibacteria group bacterium]|nr:MAG: rhomboid family intramembrane serine protease [Patescibacteria group bacterium]